MLSVLHWYLFTAVYGFWIECIRTYSVTVFVRSLQHPLCLGDISLTLDYMLNRLRYRPLFTDGSFELVMHLISQGFGVAAKSTQECRRVDPMAIVVFHQADVGEFIRNEDTLT